MKPTAHRTVIVAAVDRTAATNQVVHTARSLACMLPGAEVHLVHVVEVGQPSGAHVVPLTDTLEAGSLFLDDIKARIAEQFTGRIVAHLGVDLPGRHIVELAKELEADLVVVGTHGKGGLARLLLGSVSQHVVNHASCAVLVARPKDEVAVPEIEPACSKCLELRKETGGEKQWCVQHSVKHAHARTHYATPQPFALGSMLLRPEA